MLIRILKWVLFAVADCHNLNHKLELACIKRLYVCYVCWKFHLTVPVSVENIFIIIFPWLELIKFLTEYLVTSTFAFQFGIFITNILLYYVLEWLTSLNYYLKAEFVLVWKFYKCFPVLQKVTEIILSLSEQFSFSFFFFLF